MGDPSPQNPIAAKGHWIAVARLLRPQGRHGELLADPLTDLLEIFTTGRQFRLAASPNAVANAPVVTLQGCWRPVGRNAGRLVLKLDGTESINAAEDLKTRELYLPEAELPALGEDTYLVRDLVGCLLFDGEHLLGTVTDLQFPVGPDGHTRLADAVDLLVLQPANTHLDSDPVLVPFVRSWLEHVNTTQKRITMHLPPGLLNDTAEN